MPQLSANLSMLFTEVDFLDRFERAAKAGFRAVEFQFPYAFAAHEIRARIEGNGLTAVLHNLPGGDWAAGDRGITCLPDRVAEFRDGVGKAIEYAHALGVPRLNALAGKAPAGVAHPVLHSTMVGNLKFAAEKLQAAGLDLLIEPVNTRDVPGFFVNRSDQALALIDEVGASNVYLQFDLYHAQRMEGELAGTLEKQLARIGHIQLADNPGRHEPGTGEINFPFLFAHLDRIGWRGHVGCEYIPAAGTEAGLGWAKGLLG